MADTLPLGAFSTPEAVDGWLTMLREERAKTERITALEAENARLREGLEKAAAQFEFYQGQHEAKGTREGREKAHTNADMASMCRALLQGGPDGR